MHDDLARSLNLLETIQRDVVQVGRRVQVTFLVSQHLLEEDVPTSLPLLALEEEVVRRGDLVVLVVLDVSHRLIQITVWANATRGETVLNLGEVLL